MTLFFCHHLVVDTMESTRSRINARVNDGSPDSGRKTTILWSTVSTKCQQVITHALLLDIPSDWNLCIFLHLVGEAEYLLFCHLINHMNSTKSLQVSNRNHAEFTWVLQVLPGGFCFIYLFYLFLWFPFAPKKLTQIVIILHSKAKEIQTDFLELSSISGSRSHDPGQINCAHEFFLQVAKKTIWQTQHDPGSAPVTPAGSPLELDEINVHFFWRRVCVNGIYFYLKGKKIQSIAWIRDLQAKDGGNIFINSFLQSCLYL